MTAILFVCTGNTCRSPMAETIFRQMLEKEGIKDVEVFSRGIAAMDDMPASEGTQEALKAIGLKADAHRAKTLKATDLERADLVLVMEDGHRAAVLGEYPSMMEKTFLLKSYTGGQAVDIADPIGGSPKDYEKCRIEIQDCLLGLLFKVKERKQP